MKRQSRKFKPVGLHTSPWILLGGVLILLVIVVILAIDDINREKENMSRVLLEKGAAWIRAFEAGTRVGMRRMMRGEDHIQYLLEEAAAQPDVLYLAVTDDKGFILAHNNTTLKGTPHIDPRSLDSAVSGFHEKWRVVKNGEGRQVFEVFREFRPLSRQEIRRRVQKSQTHDTNAMMGGSMHRQDRGFLHPKMEDGKRFVFIGLDITPFELARKEDLRNTLILSSVLLLLGFGGYVSLFWFQGYQAARRSLQESDTFTDEVVASLPVGLMATDKEGKIAFFNATAERITGMHRRHAFGRGLAEVLPQEWLTLKKTLDQGRPIIEQEKEYAFAQGKAVPVSLSAVRITSREGLFLGNIVILRDIAEVRRLQEQIRRTEKLAAIGGLAAGVAHEIRNPLSSIKGIATYFRDKLDTPPADRETAGIMIQEVDRLNRVISALLEFARPAELKRESVDLRELLEHSLRLVQQDARAKDITIDLGQTSADLTHDVDPDRLSQCLLNLYLNAIQAMEDGGTLSIGCSREKDIVVITVADTGPGIDLDDLQQVFDPYFTTKPSGTGLGLAIVHKIVEAHDGRLEVDSEPGKGTTFKIALPIKPNVGN